MAAGPVGCFDGGCGSGLGGGRQREPRPESAALSPFVLPARSDNFECPCEQSSVNTSHCASSNYHRASNIFYGGEEGSMMELPAVRLHDIHTIFGPWH